MATDVQVLSSVAAVDARGAPGGFPAEAKPAGKPVQPPLPSSGPPESGGESGNAVGLVFEVKPQSHEVVVKVVDRDTHKVIRTIPPEEFQRMRTTMDNMVGLFVDHTG